MNRVISLIKHTDRLFLIPLAFSFLSVFLIINTLAVFYKVLPNRLPLFYSLSWGQSELVSKQQFLILPAVILLISLVNTLLASQIHPSQFVLRKILMGSQVLVSLIVLVTAFKILVIFI